MRKNAGGHIKAFPFLFLFARNHSVRPPAKAVTPLGRPYIAVGRNRFIILFDTPHGFPLAERRGGAFILHASAVYFE